MEGHVIMDAVEMKEGDDVDVKRLMPVAGNRHFDPFVLWDHFTIKQGAGFPTHPHRGFEGLTYLFEGSMRHKDNLGNDSTIMAGGAQRFTAGKGLSHSEMPSSMGATSGIQLWINLPQRLKKVAPSYQQLDSADITQYEIENGFVREIVGAGSKLTLLTPVRYLDVTLNEGGVFVDEISSQFEGFVYVVEGRVEHEKAVFSAGQACFMKGLSQIALKSLENSRFMLCFGSPHGEPIRQYGPFVD